jgi:multiple sugar transport system ATP-binding protein
MRTELQRIHEELGTTTIYVTHDQEEAMTMSDRIIILADGVIQQTGTADQIYQHPANLFVADFIGSPSMNFFDVSLQDGTLVGNSFDCSISSELASEIEAHGADDLVMGIRPEDVEIATGAEEGSISTEVDVVEPVGSDNYIYVGIGSDDCTVRTPASVRPSEGDIVELKFDEDDLHVFDSNSGENILARKEKVAPTT